MNIRYCVLSLRVLEQPMSSKYILVSFGIYLAVIFMAQGAQAQKIKIEHNPNESLTDYKSYSWIPNDSYQRPFLAMHVIGAIDEQLQSKGLTRVETGGDLIVTSYGALDTDLNIAYRPDIYVMPALNGPVWWNQGTLVAGSSSAVQITKGTLVVDIADPRSKQLKWRAIANSTLDPHKPKKSIEKINKAIEKMFRGFPSSR